jgi:hypothetical protein
MEKQDSVVLATKLVQARDSLEEAIEYMHQKLDPDERAPLIRAIGDIFGSMTDQINSRLVIANRELHDVLFRGLPKKAPDDFLQMAQTGKRGQ